MALQVCLVLVRRHLPRPAAVLPPGRRMDVLPRRGPRVVVLVVVLAVERLEHEQRRLEPPRDAESRGTNSSTRPIVEPWPGHVVLVVATNPELAQVQAVTIIATTGQPAFSGCTSWVRPLVAEAALRSYLAGSIQV